MYRTISRPASPRLICNNATDAATVGRLDHNAVGLVGFPAPKISEPLARDFGHVTLVGRLCRLSTTDRSQQNPAEPARGSEQKESNHYSYDGLLFHAGELAISTTSATWLISRLSRLRNAKSQNRTATSRDKTPHPNGLELRARFHKNTEDDATKNDPSAAACS